MGAPGTHVINLSNDPELLGLCLTSQASSITAALTVEYDNALDFTIGG